MDLNSALFLTSYRKIHFFHTNYYSYRVKTAVSKYSSSGTTHKCDLNVQNFAAATTCMESLLPAKFRKKIYVLEK